MNFLKIIPPFWSPADKHIIKDLMAIDYYCVTLKEHPRIFRFVVEDLVCRLPHQMRDIERIVSGVAKRIRSEGQVLHEDPSTHGRHARHVKTLQNGLEALETMHPTAPTHSETQRQAQERMRQRERAIVEDRCEFEKLVRIQSQVPSDGQSGVDLVYNMEDPQETPIPIPRYNPTCLDVRRYLQTSGIAVLPDVWARYQDTDAKEHDHVELLWKLVPGRAKIGGHCLKFVERADGDDISIKGPYIVALKFMTKEERAVPVPLDIACLGRPCCNQRCANLKAHLTGFWPENRVTHAVTIRDGDDVLTKAFDDGYFSPLTNDLCLHLE